jgi:hypothetical protein
LEIPSTRAFESPVGIPASALSRRVTRPKGELISQKSGRRSTFLSQPHRHPLLFDAKYPLTSKNSPSILPSIEINTLSNKGSFAVRDMVKHEVFDKVLIADPNLC